ncbi:MAG: hypothetical protein HYV07_16135 [Deltaproteobacteria bacterium]|nr:hypothetical protein [Deltaproteobacteria bacterium]
MLASLLSLAVVAAPGAAFESAHAADLAAHAEEEPRARRRILSLDGASRVERIIYGYYPYWVDAWESQRFDLLTHLAYFSLEMETDGTVSNRHGWPDSAFVETAHAHGLIVEVCFTLFGGSSVSALLSSSSSRARAISTMISEMEAGGADGIDIDFEDLSAGTRDAYTNFVRELRDALIDRGHLDATLSLAIPAVDWSDNFDLGALAADVNVFFIMGYGYHWAGSGRAGPVGQLRVTESWAPYISVSMQKSIAHYVSLVAPEDRARIVFGAPYYGYEWPVTSANLFATTSGQGSSRTYSAARRSLDLGRSRRFDDDSVNPWQAFMVSGVNRQLWYDDETSLDAKYELVLEQEIGGTGMWALGYDEGYAELWQALERRFVDVPPAREGTRWRPIPIPIEELPFVANGDTKSGPSNYFDYYSCRPGIAEYGRETVYGFTTCAPGVLRAGLSVAAGADVDLHLLDGTHEDACLEGADLELAREIDPGRYLLVADSFVAANVPREGEYELTVDFEATGSGCSSGETCLRGACKVLPGIPTSSIGRELDWGPHEIPPVFATRGRVVTSTTPRPPRDRSTDLPVASEGDRDGGCGCEAAPSSASLLPGALVLLLLLTRRRPSEFGWTSV